VLATALACSFGTAPANARARVFVASYGNDSNPCTFGSPCKTFQAAINAVDAGGEVTAIDSAGFGPINITKAVTITSPDGVEAGIVPVVGGNAISITAAASDDIVLRGLTLNGSGFAFNGIVFNSGGSLTVTNCTVQNFITNGTLGAGNGIFIQPTSGTISISVTNTIVSNNARNGIFYSPPSGSPTTKVVIDHVFANNNDNGIVFATANPTGGSTLIAVSNTSVSSNATGGLVANNGASGNPLSASFDNVSAVNNGNEGIGGAGTAKIVLGRSTVTGNVIGIENNISVGNFSSYGNNQINQNTVNIAFNPLNTSFALQ
jgi:hypothetical protein